MMDTNYLALRPFLQNEMTDFPSISWGSEWGYHDNTKHFIFWLCNMKQLNFRHFNTNCKKFFETVIFFPERGKNGGQKAKVILFSISRNFRPFYDNAGLFQEISEGYRRFPKAVEDFRRVTKGSDHCPKNLPIPSETVNIKKLASLTSTLKIMGK